MVTLTKNYQKYVLDDLQKYDGLRQPVKASPAECLLIRSKSPKILHPNPDDEFSMPEIGPNYTIIGNYTRQFSRYSGRALPSDVEPLQIEKMAPDGYLLLNGHHRWFAAMQLGIKSVPVQIVNLVHKEDLEKMIQTGSRDKRAVFDLDEVLFLPDDAPKGTACAVPPMFPLNQLYKERMKPNAPALLRHLDQMGYDIWIYTAGFHSIEYINSYFGLYHVKIHGIINGAKRRRTAPKEELAQLKKAMAERYHETLHIDSDHLLRIRSGENDFDYITLNATNETWAAKTLKTVRDFQKS